ncbi:hypothetical protein ONE63_001049 [Megalurothrips usitatus]|uniref:Secreted RxLR effector protein 161-like n=1 Tax=Megalurothrips usitatus TaxID=439358 RepID=A0AAV7XF32_9NEOP|nr:hypothetical protein ONE63_001049 [Megalurothrips usitatus]
MMDCKPKATPMEIKRTNFESTNDRVITHPKTAFPYREAVGSLLYLSCKTRPDLAFAVNYCSRFVENPSPENVNDLKRILRYLRGTMDNGIMFHKIEDSQVQISIQAFCDADYAGSGTSGKCKSTSGYVLFCGQGPITWCSRRQATVASATSEAEFIAAAECCKEIQYVKSLLKELTGKELSTTLHVDNQSTIKMIQAGQLNKKSKHLQVRYFYLSEAYDEGLFQLRYCPTNENIADIFTKALNTTKFANLSHHLLSGK